MATRGIRNNNPANIRKGSIWQGLHPTQSDKDFCVFVAPQYGVRALLHVLWTYYVKYDIASLRGIINRFAPASDGNYPDKYIAYIQNEFREAGFSISPTDRFLMSAMFCRKTAYDENSACRDVIYHLCHAICMMESKYDLPKSIFDLALCNF